jgi:hypothetical protein
VADVAIERIEEDARGFAFEVTVEEAGSRSVHRVTVSREDLARMAGEDASPEELVRRAFRFLLEREPKESILTRFDLRDIGSYFPEFEREFGRRGG